MSDVYDTYFDDKGIERWCSNGKVVLIKKRGKWKASRKSRKVKKGKKNVDRK